MTITKRYKWESPYDWLLAKVDDWTPEQLRAEVLNLAGLAGNDTLQDVFQSEMESDGFFRELHVHVEERRNLKFEGDPEDCPICEEDTVE